ncbi:hypothetical protein G7054_g8143 [Neopestalotiopsis clavispora]|nr:hypothetical protein G7054_g8143 [Neopestalotiopsis clavispora]
MPSNKDRLYIALYARGGKSVMPGGEDKYHWGILVGPKIESDDSIGKLYHAKEKMMQQRSHFMFKERNISMLATSMILVRILVGKIENHERLASILRSTPIRAEQPGWNCVGWVQEAHKAAEHRFDGKHRPGQFDHKKVATYDMVDTKGETVP